MSGSTHDGRRSAILAIDSATTQVVVATGSPAGRIDGLTTWPAGYRHGETLLPTIGRVLGEGNIRRSRLVAIVVGTGPGAFTGLRVGLATAKGLAHGLGIPIVGVSTGSALLAAASATDGIDGRPVVLLPAGPSDRLVIRPDRPPELLVAGTEPDAGRGRDAGRDRPRGPRRRRGRRTGRGGTGGAGRRADRSSARRGSRPTVPATTWPVSSPST